MTRDLTLPPPNMGHTSHWGHSIYYDYYYYYYYYCDNEDDDFRNP